MKNFSKFLAIVLSIAITVPMFALSAGAVDSLTVEEPQIISDTLQAIMETSTEETTRVAVWLKGSPRNEFDAELSGTPCRCDGGRGEQHREKRR